MITVSPAGLYCAAGDFHIDPWRPVPRAVLTHAHADHTRPGCQHYLVPSEGLDLTRVRLGEKASLQAVSYGQKLRLGEVRVSLHPAGHILGSAQVRIEGPGGVWVVSGDYKRDPDPTCKPFEVLRCDTFITEATFALPCYRWPPVDEVIGEILEWLDHCRREGLAALLCCYALGKAQRVLAGIARHDPGRRVFLHGAMVDLVEAYRARGVPMAPTLPLLVAGKPALAGELVLAPPSAAGSPWCKRLGAHEVGFASGWMLIRGQRRRRSYDRGFVLSDHADWPALIRTIRETGASRVLATHGNTEALVRYLREQGVDAAALATELGGEN